MQKRIKLMMAGTKLWLAAVVFISVAWQGICDESGPRIKAKHGILYQDGKPCFLVGVFGDNGYDMCVTANRDWCRGNPTELVPGKQGQAGKISFQKTDKPLNRWCNLSGPLSKTRVWADNKYKALKFWVKGDGSKVTVILVAENWSSSLNKATFSANLGQFLLENTDWKQVVIPLEDKSEALKQAGSCYLSCGKVEEAFSFLMDEITVVKENGEEVVLYGFDRETSNRVWNRWDEREKYKDDPVYKAIWNDPLYHEISAESLRTIGISTYHLAAISQEYVTDVLPMTSRSKVGEAMMCEALKGLPIVPGYAFDWGAYYSDKAEAWVKRAGLPPSVLQRNTKGSPVGSYMALCPEDPVGQRIFKEYWQQSARFLLEHGANIYAYELINENSGFYVCGCQRNRDLFMERMKTKYGDIAALNKVWGTDYKDFEAVRARLPELGWGNVAIKGLSIEWNKFLEDRYVEVLQEGGKWIHVVEDELGKPHALMGQMGHPSWDLMGYGGADMYKMAQGLDVIETEGGVVLGSDCFVGDVNQLTAVMANKGRYTHQMALDLADAASGDKPIINTEHYLGRYKGKAREPISRTDIITSLWEEFLRGASAVHTYQWGVEYASKEEAIANGENRALLSPYLFPRDSLNGYRDVQEEIARVADVVMERPRLGRGAETAVLLSRPTARYLIGLPSWAKDWKKEHKFFRSHEAFYTCMLESHYPMRYLYEEQLAEGSARKYKVIFAPHSDNTYPETVKYLSDYVKKGGTLVCFGDALQYDEYGNEINNRALLGLERKKVDAFVEQVKLSQDGSIKVISKKELVPDKAVTLVKFPERTTPFITVNALGRGKVYCVNADVWQLEDNSIRPLMDYLAQAINLEAPLSVEGLDGVKKEGIEAYIIARGAGKVIFLVNDVPYIDQVVKLKLKGMKEEGKYYLADVAQNRLYTRGGNEILSGKDLREGLNLLLPSQQRVVLLVTNKKYDTTREPVELLSDAAAGEWERNIKADIEKMRDKEGKIRELVFGVRGIAGAGNYALIKACMQAAAGDDVEIKLLNALSNCTVSQYGLKEGADSVLTYELGYKSQLSDTEIEKIQEKIFEALSAKYNIKIIKGVGPAAILKRQAYHDLGGCLVLNLRTQANMGFADEKADDQKGGLFDEGRSLVNLPLGKQQFAGVPFDMIDPAQNNGKACIVLKGQPKPFFSEKVEGIEVKRKFKNLYVLHNACYCASDDALVYHIRLNYGDESQAEMGIRAGNEIKDWFNRDPQECELPNAKLGWQGKAQEKSGQGEAVNEINVALYCAKLVNPHPEKEVTTLDLVSANSKAVPAIFGVTVEE